MRLFHPRFHLAFLAGGMIHWLSLAVALLIAASPGAASAATENPRIRSIDYWSGPQTREDGKLRLTKVHINAEVAGAYATTTVEMTFANMTDRVLEGDISFKMPKEAVFTGYALDIEGVMVDGVITYRQIARKVYEDAIRARTDPGVADLLSGNVFHTTVYPVAPEGARTIRFSFSSYLGPRGTYAVPFDVPRTVDDVSISLKAHGRKPPRGVELPGGLRGRWTQTGNHWTLVASGRRVELKDSLQFRQRDVGKLTLFQGADGSRYFEILDRLPRGRAAGKAKAKTIRIYWDTSLSAGGTSNASMAQLAADIISRARPRRVDIIPFATRAQDMVTLEGRPSGQDIADTLQGFQGAGASNFEAAFDISAAPTDICLLFSDGRKTWGADRVQTPACRLYAIAPAGDANMDYLHYLSQPTGGGVFRLGDSSRTAIVRAIMKPRPALISSDGGEGTEVFSLPAPKGWFRLIGRTGPDDTQVTATFALAASNSRKSYKLDSRTTEPFGGMVAFWANAKIKSLRQQAVVDHDMIFDVSQRFGVETDETVFMVLEDLDEYAQLGLEAPETFPGYDAEEYADLLADWAEERTEDTDSWTQTVREKWAKMKEWWQRDFTAEPFVEQDGHVDRSRFIMRNPPAAPQMLLEEDGGDFDVEEVVVTGSRVTEGPTDSISIVPWQADRPYLKSLQSLPAGDFDTAFEKVQDTQGHLPAFYFDVAELLFNEGDAAAASDMAFNVLDLTTTDHETKLILAGKLWRFGNLEAATALYEAIMREADFLPQPKRQLALALAQQADGEVDRDARIAGYMRALELLHAVVSNPASVDYHGIELIALVEAGRINARLEALGVTQEIFDPSLMALMDVDLRVLISWNTDASDMDLWVTEPSGERAFYNHPRTRMGGRLSNDMTAGYGPEEYMLRKAADGTYMVQADQYASDRLRINGPTKIRVDIFKNYGRADEIHKVTEIEVTSNTDGALKVADIVFETSADEQEQKAGPAATDQN